MEHHDTRPRRFGKSLTISTLDAMFSGKTELFRGLAAERWVREQAKQPAPVVRISMAGLDADRGRTAFEDSLNRELGRVARQYRCTLPGGGTVLDTFKDLLFGLHEQAGPVVVLIDEYDKPILDHIGDPEQAEIFRRCLRSFYTVLKDYDRYLRFVMLTGISKFSKTGVFSAMNNLQDISLLEDYGDIVGYTQEELEANFSGWIDRAANRTALAREALLEKIKNYYDGFCFDGTHRLYNPFSVLNFFSSGRMVNYWYNSGSPSFIVDYMKRHAIQAPEEYRHIQVTTSFADAQEIERARPESFLYQSGYLTIEQDLGDAFILDYPNREVLDSLCTMYLDHVYRLEGFVPLCSKFWQTLRAGDIAGAMQCYNTALAGIPYGDFGGPVREHFYRALFLMLLRGAGMTAGGEMQTHQGRSDVVALFPDRAVVLEFKLAANDGEVAQRLAEGLLQIKEKGYALPFLHTGRAITKAAVVINTQSKQASAKEASA